MITFKIIVVNTFFLNFEFIYKLKRTVFVKNLKRGEFAPRFMCVFKLFEDEYALCRNVYCSFISTISDISFNA